MYVYFWMNLGQLAFGLLAWADIGDVSAFLDTANAFRLCAGILTVGTFLLNTLALALQARRFGGGVHG